MLRWSLIGRKIHRKSDSLVNVKLALALVDQRLYATAIGLFLPIYAEVEKLLSATPHPKLEAYAKLLPVLARKRAFEEDERVLLGPGWEAVLANTADKAGPVPRYLEHLRELAKRDPEMLLVYSYHLHMALLSGGQILKRLVTSSLALPPGGGGTAIYEFNKHVGELKEEVRSLLDKLLDVGAMGEERARAFEDESIRLFVMNNEVVGSFRVEGGQLLRGLLRFRLFVFVLLLLVVLALLTVYRAFVK